MSLVAELRRRNVFRVGIAYIVLAWLLLQVGDTLDAFAVEEGRRKIEEFYHTKGFPKTTVTLAPV